MRGKAYIFVCISIILFAGGIAAQQESVNGITQLFYETGELASEGLMVNGQPEGLWKNYYKTGKLKSQGRRENFLLEGIWKFYNEEEILVNEITYSKNKKDGVSRKYNLDGGIIQQSRFKDNLLNGREEYFFQNGEIQKEIPYIKGIKEGTGYTYSKDDGRVIQILKYSNDVLVLEDNINRYNENQEKQGKWITFHPNRVNKLVGNYVNGKKSGIFKEYDEEGKLIGIYNYDNGVLKETSDEFSVLNVKKKYFANGSVKSETSYSKSGKKQGYYYEYDEKGNLIKSEFYEQDLLLWEGYTDKQGRKQHLWKYYYPNGTLKAEGAYINDKEEGDWKYYFESGKLEQKGHYVNGKPDKKWEWFFESEKPRRIENYDEGILEGNYIEYDQYNYVIIEGKYLEGYKVGKWFYGVGDHVEVGKYKDGLKEGMWEYYHYELEKENLYFKGGFKEGLPDGVHTYYYEPGSIKWIRNYKLGKPNGSWIEYFKTGVQSKNLDYDKGEIVKINGIPIKID